MTNRRWLVWVMVEKISYYRKGDAFAVDTYCLGVSCVSKYPNSLHIT